MRSLVLIFFKSMDKQNADNSLNVCTICLHKPRKEVFYDLNHRVS